MKDRERRESPGNPPGPELDAPAVSPGAGWTPVPERAGHSSATESALSSSPPDTAPCQRRDERFYLQLEVAIAFIDPVRDPIRDEPCYHTSDDDVTVSLSRRGAGLRCARPPELGTRLLLQIRPPGERRAIDVIARTRWTRVEYVAGETGARAVAAVGVELLGGAPKALDRYEAWLADLAGSVGVAATGATG